MIRSMERRFVDKGVTFLVNYEKDVFIIAEVASVQYGWRLRVL